MYKSSMSDLPLQSLKSPVNFLALGMGTGLTPKAPGTVGTVLGLLLALLFPVLTSLWVVAISSIAGVYLCGASAKKLGVHDHPGIVWDEFCGIWLTLALAPSGWYWVLAAFVLFRFFDILKPWPINYLDKNLEGGLGIMLDDLVAGLMAAAVLYMINLLQIYLMGS